MDYINDTLYSTNLGWGPNVNALKAQTYKIQGPSKLKHFILQIISVNSKLNNIWINCEIVRQQCEIEKYIKRLISFKCPISGRGRYHISRRH